MELEAQVVGWQEILERAVPMRREVEVELKVRVEREGRTQAEDRVYLELVDQAKQEAMEQQEEGVVEEEEDILVVVVEHLMRTMGLAQEAEADQPM